MKIPTFLVVTLALSACGGTETPTPRGDSHRIIGDFVSGDVASGDPIAGDTATGDPSAGDTATGDPIAGDTATGDPIAGDTATGDPIAGDPVAGDPVGGDPAGGDTSAGDPTSGDPASGDPTAGDSGVCHAYDFGGGVVAIEPVSSLPSMTGGAVVLGSYDVVEAQTTGSLTGTIRSTWVFESDTVMQILEQITISGTPPVPTPRTLSWQTNGARLLRTQTCAGTTSFDNGYTVRTDANGTFLDVLSGTLMFTYQLRL